MSSSWTVRQAVDRIVELGLVDAQTPAQKLDPDEFDKTLDYFGPPDKRAALRLLCKLGIVYEIDWEDFEGACQEGLEVYQRQLDNIAAASRGQLAITDIELIDDDVTDDGGEHVLRFRCNGVPEEWRISHCEDEDFEAQLTFGTYVWALTLAGSPQRWCIVTSEASGEPPYYIFADPDALGQLGVRFGLTFHAS